MRRVIIACCGPMLHTAPGVGGVLAGRRAGDPSSDPEPVLRSRRGVPGARRDSMAQHRIRCPDCGRRSSASETTCPGCRSSLLQMCECGATAHMAAAACAACGAELQAPAFARRPIALRVVAVLVLVGLAGTAGAAYWNARRRHERKAEIWQLRDAAFAAVKAGRFREALPVLERYTAARPRDAEMQYLLAVTERETDADPMAGVDAARAALDVDGSFSEAASFLAVAFERVDDVEGALGYARRAVAGSRPRSSDHRLVAALELRRARPDVDAAIEALRRARIGAEDDPRLTVMQALLELRRRGDVPLSALPGDVLGLVAHAEEIVLGADADLAADPLVRLAEVELALAHRQIAPARRLAGLLVASTDAPRDVRLRARVLLGRAALLEGDAAAARAAFVEVLREAPSRAAAADVARACRAAGDLGLAQELLVGVIVRPDADPGIGAVLGSVQFARGDLDAAAASLRAARRDDPDDVALLLQLGDVLSSRGDLDVADDAYAAAEERSAPGEPTPTLRRAMLSVSRSPGRRARRAAASAALVRIDERLGDGSAWTSGAALEIRGRLELLAGRLAAAETVLRRALDLAPQDAMVRVSLAEALLSGGAPDSRERASSLLLEAAEIAPFDERCVERVASLLIAMGEPQQASTVCQRFLDRMGDRPAILGTAAVALRGVGRWAEAADRLKRMRATGGDPSGDVLRGLVDSLLRAGASADARRVVAELDPGGADGRLPLLLALHGATPEQRVERLRREGPGLELAFALLAQGEREPAVETLRAALATDPADVAVRQVLVAVLLDAADAPTADALAEARRVVAATPATAGPGVREVLDGALALADGEAAAALDLLDVAVEERPEDPYASFLRGRALFESGAREEALAPLRRAVSLPGALPGFAIVLSRCLHAVARDAESPAARERLLWESLLHDPRHVAATVDLVNLLFESARDAEAARLARRLVATGGAPPELARGLRRLALAATLRANGLGGLLELVDEFPFEDTESADRLVDGLLLLRAGRDAEAVRLLDEVLERHPQSPIAAFAAIEADVRRGRLETARELAARADASAEGSWRYRVAFVQALLRAGHDREALDESEAAARAQPAHEELVAARVHAALQLGDVEGALRTIVAAESAAEPAAGVRLATLRCAVLREHGRPEDALRVARTLRPRCGDDAALTARVALAEAEALLRLSRFDELAAIEADLSFESLGVESLSGAPDATRVAARAAFVRGTLAMVNGRTEDAVRWLRRSVRLDGSQPAAANNLAWLYARRPSRALEGLGLARAATAAEPRNPEYWDTLATCARTAGRGEEAEAAWRTALELLGPETQPPSALRVAVWIGLAELLSAESRFDEAVRLARRVLEAQPVPETQRRARAILRLG